MTLQVSISTLVAFALAAAASHAAIPSQPKLTPYVLGQAAAPAPQLLQTPAADTITLTGVGRESSAGKDEAAFAGFETDATAFTFVARVAKGFAEGQAKYGIGIRAGLAGNDKAVLLRFDGFKGHRCWQWLMRHYEATSTHDVFHRSSLDGTAKKFDQTEGVWMKLVRRYPYVELFLSADGTTWEEMSYRSVLLPQKAWVGFHVTSAGSENVNITYDNIRYTVDEPIAPIVEFTPKPRTCKVYFAKINVGTADKPVWGNYSVIIPEGTDLKKIRAYYWGSATKEIEPAAGGRLAFRPAPQEPTKAKLRLPADFPEDKDEGVYVTDKLSPNYGLLADHGVLVLNSLAPAAFMAGTKRLAEISGIPQLEHLPFISYGESATGGIAAQAARSLPDRAAGTIPTLIGPAGINEVDKHHTMPTLWVVGSRDTTHLADITKALPIARAKNAVWAGAPMWFAYHVGYRRESLMLPYTIEIAKLRVPADHDFSKGPAKLNILDPADGWFGLADSWNGNHPQVVPVRGFNGDASKASWLPNERIARLWQAFVSNNPRTMIHYPRYDHGDISRQSKLPADQPFEIVASGPIMDGVKVEYFHDAQQPLKVVRSDPANPYRVTVAGLPVGLHVIYAVVRYGDETEITRPVTIGFHPAR